MDYLKSENCNSTYCKSCIFHPISEKRTPLSVNRINEITNYLAKFESSHICHVTDKTCYGAMQFQANILFAMEIIKENTVEAFLNEAKNKLGFI